MKITFCGTGAGASYVADRGGSSVMIEVNGDAMLVDCGPGAVRRIYKAGVEFGAIKVILITHLHYDHAVGLPELFNRFGRMGNDPPRILGPAGIADYIESCKRLITVSTSQGLPPQLQALHGEQIVPGQVYEVGDFTADAIEVPHGPDIQALSWRVRAEGSTVVVSGDLKTDEEFMVPFASDADLLIHEAYSHEGLEALFATLPTDYARESARQYFEPTHSEVSVVAEIAETADVKRLALTHLVPGEQEDVLVRTAQDHFSGEAFIAEPGHSLEIA
ncbi:MAG: MBL fold metallo-hydrolase [Chloroflexi bacterium]|nr:MBL fold metallo-hydrolase [Chloroflexota bacterium]